MTTKTNRMWGVAGRWGRLHPVQDSVMATRGCCKPLWVPYRPHRPAAWCLTGRQKLTSPLGWGGAGSGPICMLSVLVVLVVIVNVAAAIENFTLASTGLKGIPPFQAGRWSKPPV